MTTKTPDVDKLAKSVVKNHNLRALMLRLFDGEDARDVGCDRRSDAEQSKAITAAKRHKLGEWPNPISGGPFKLTPLGRQVAIRVRNVRWTSTSQEMTIGCDERTDIVRTQVRRPDGRHAFAVDSKPDEPNLGHEIVDLLNARDLAAAKRYEVAP